MTKMRVAFLPQLDHNTLISRQSTHRAIHIDLQLRPLDVIPACRKLTSNINSSHDLHRPEAKRFRVKLADLNIPKIYLVKIFLDLLEAENLKSKDLANEHPAFMPADVAAVVNSPEFKSLRMNVLD